MNETLGRASYSEVTDYLDRYLALQGTDYGVMIDGPWGSGKTHFLKTYLERRNAHVLAGDPLSPRGRYWYASLAGVNNAEQVYEQFFAAEHGKARGIATEIVLRFGSYFSKKTVGTPDDAAKIRRAMLDPRYRVLVFDDLERSGMPVLEALALVNSFAKDGVKVIVVAHDDEIMSRERSRQAPPDGGQVVRSDYERQKEKFIGKTIRVGSVVGDVLPHFVKLMTSPIAKASVERASEEVLHVFEASKSENLRSLRQAIEDFDHLASALEPILKEHPKAADEILTHLVAIEVEFRGGVKGMSYEGILNLSFNPSGSIFGKETGEVESRLLKTYPMVSWKDPVVPHRHLATLLKTGTIAKEALKRRVEKHPTIAPQQDIAPWRALWSWSALTSTEYTHYRNLLAEQLRDRQVLHPGELLHAIGEVLVFSDFGDDLLDGADPELFFKEYIDDVVTDRTLQPLTELFDASSGSHFGLVYMNHDTPVFKTIKGLVRDGVRRIRDVNLSATLPQFLEQLRSDQSTALRLNNYGEKKGNLQGVPFLHHSNPEEFASLLVEDFAPRETVMGALVDRYLKDTSQNSLKAEHAWLEEVENAFKKLADSAVPPHRRLLQLRYRWMTSELDKHLGRVGATATPPSPS